jgi:hypothetical protein
MASNVSFGTVRHVVFDARRAKWLSAKRTELGVQLAQEWR